MKKSYILWTALASFFTIMYIRSALIGTLGDITGAVFFILIPIVLWFVAYRRFKEYKEWRIEYESNLKKNEAVINAANAYANTQEK